MELPPPAIGAVYLFSASAGILEASMTSPNGFVRSAAFPFR
jgi:hypothetical protein